MTEEDLLPLICAGSLILIAVAIIAFIALGMKPFSYSKRKEGQNTCLTITARRNLAKASVVARFGTEEVRFERKRIRKDQSVDFVFPASDKKAKLIVEVDPGNEQTLEV